MADLPDDFRRMMSHVTQLNSVLAAAKSAVPESCEGSDQSGAVRVFSGQGDVPQQVQLATDWERRLGAGQLGAAVLEAAQAAAMKRLQAWAQDFGASNWKERVGDVQSAPTEETHFETADAMLDLSQVRPRPLGELAEEVMTSLERVSSSLSTPLEGRGQGGGGGVEVVITKSGLASCEVNERWAAGRTSTAISQALNSAFDSARLALTEAEASAPAAGADRLLREALALLSDRSRLAEGS
ncbi:hypothetical protein [Streptacidiphilus fuscans]|uniref:YbaB/EbfC DNA-binding family protein n=1 Tax=Streptacidiphilus fuscans TaxID=2789292 RepID=A0A931FI09_9ACTN|nr:hypothetical protein [Streptacidiphilus fuscans]MBF9071653.1 hypothetical protein [Streptacidiphilus fuscans]MBF9072860.1 hypothetical protein [Streptacidiphilus fuscans]